MLGEKELLALAKKHLDLPHISDRIVPKWYIRELETHIRLYPDDINFIVKPDLPGKGLGTVTCLEKGCARRRISLGPRATADDGGLKEGFGSLKAYREHIMDSPSHAASWPDNEVEIIESTSATRPSLKYKAPLGGRDTSTSTPSSSVKRSIKTEPTTKLLSASQSSSGSRASSSRSRAMPEVLMSSVPRKRGFTSGSSTPKIKPDPDVIEISDDEEQPVVKKLKKESSFSKKPLSQSNSFIGSNQQLSDASQKPQQNVDDIREQLSEIQKSIVGLEVRLARYRRKSTQTKADKTHVKNLQQEVARLERQKAELNARLPSTLHVTRGPSFRDLAAQNPGFNPVKKEPRATKLERVEPHVPQAPIASSSNTRLPPAQQPNTPMPPGLMFKFKLDPDVKMVGAGAEAVVAPAYRHPAFDPPKPKISPKQENPPKQEPPKQEIVASKVAHYNDPADSDVEMENYVNGVLPPADEDERYDEQGNFYGRGRDMFQGPTAKADDIDKFLVEAGNAEQFDGNANVAKALEKLQLPGLYAPIPGMQIALMPHQVIGVAWMLEHEKSYSKGGCLGDEMGLGKTVQTLATMVSNRSSDPRVKTTLIVAPVALLDQWQMEIELKTDCGMKCYIYHGSNKIRKMNDLLEFDVVLTSFHTLAHEWPDPEEEERKQKKAEKAKKAGKGKKNGIDGFVVDDSDDENAGAPKKRTREKKLGLLMQTKWYRVILDEGQNIRNKKTRVSRAVTMLESTYRWTLTGTPIINSLTDAYAQLRFLKIRPWYDWDEFHKHIGCHEKKNPKLASSRLQAIFAAVLLRRKKDSMLDGKRLVELPPKSVELVRLEFTAEEREIYSMVEAQSQAIFNRFLRAGTVLKNYHQVLVLLLRLRQICDHPCLIQESDSANAFIVPVDESDEGAAPAARAELARARELISDEFVARMKYKLREAALQRMEAEKESKDATVEPDECPICFDTFTDAVVTPCTHIFCKECILNVLHLPHVEDANDQHKYKAHERPCPTCRSAISGDRLFTRAAFEPTDEDLEAVSNATHPIQQVKEDRDSDIEMLDDEAISDFKGKAKAKPKRTRRKSKTYIDSEDDSEHEDLDDDLSDFIAPDDEDDDEENEYRRKLRKRAPRNRAIILDSDDEEVVFGRRPKKQEPVLQDVKGKGKMQLMSKFLPSTKMKHMMDLILQWAKDHPDEKTLVISQWTQCLQLVSDYMVENAVAHVKYQGDMDRNNRDKAVRVFMSKESAPVMLMSLKCGGVGLNLVRANRVISLDLAWSEAIESQAFDRVHRLGQNRHVQVYRLVIANTVEDRVLGMQERKKNLADGALGEGTGKKIGRLSVKELANLFGLDHRGRVL